MPVSLLPCALGLAGWLYGTVTAVLGAMFVAGAVAVARSTATVAKDMVAEKKLFRFSLLYLFLLFAALVADHWIVA